MKNIKIPSVEEQMANYKPKSDEEIDFSDIPEILDWTKAVRGRFYRPVKEPVSIRLDADVLAWFKKTHDKYQPAINKVLRDYMLANLQKS